MLTKERSQATLLFVSVIVIAAITMTCKREVSTTEAPKLGEKRSIVILKDGELEYEKDIYGWKEGEFFLFFEGYSFPWQGEDSLDCSVENGEFWVNGKLCGVDLRKVPVNNIEELASPVSVLAGPEQLQELHNSPNMIALAMYDFTGDDLSRLAELRGLRALSLRHGKDVASALVLEKKTDVTPKEAKILSDLTELRMLDLANSQIQAEGLACLGGLSKLNMLYLNNAYIGKDGLEVLKEFPELRVLNLASTSVNDRDLRHLSSLVKLEELSLQYTEVSDAGLNHLKGLTNLRFLLLTETEVSDFGLKVFMKLPNLKVLDLSKTRVTEEGLRRLKKALPDCKIMYMSNI